MWIESETLANWSKTSSHTVSHYHYQWNEYLCTSFITHTHTHTHSHKNIHTHTRIHPGFTVHTSSIASLPSTQACPPTILFLSRLHHTQTQHQTHTPHAHTYWSHTTIKEEMSHLTGKTNQSWTTTAYPASPFGFLIKQDYLVILKEVST